MLLVPFAIPAGGHEEVTPEEALKAIGVDEKAGAQVPLDIDFRDADGKAVRLADYLAGGPVVLTLNYYSCPMLCPMTLRSLYTAVGGVSGISLARDFRIVTVSIDPDDTPGAARARASELYAMVKAIPDPGTRWPFLVGGPGEIRALTEAVGFRYAKVGAEFAHPNVFIVLTSRGTVSRYLYGLEPDARDLKLALVEAADGRIGESTAMNRALLFCFHYDPVGKKYGLYARNIMKAGGVLTLVFVGALYLVLWKGNRSVSRRSGGVKG